MKYKQYQGKDGATAYRVQPCGKVEVQYRPGGKWVHDKTLTGSKLNHWRKSGNITRIYPPKHLTPAQQIVERLDAIDYWTLTHKLSDAFILIPVHPNGLIVYERKAMQSVKSDPISCRGYDEWGAERGLETINKGLSVAAHLEPRGRVIERERRALLAKLMKLP